MNLPNKAKEKETILTICTALVLLFLFNKEKNPILLQLAVCLGLAGMFSDFLTAKIHWVWMQLAQGMGRIMNKIILGIIFYLLLTPIAILSRLVKKSNPMSEKGKKTQYVERNHTYQSKDLVNPW